MSRKLIKEAIDSWGEIPPECEKQVELQKEHYLRLINKMEDYDWQDLFTTGVKINEKDGDPQIFIAYLANPVKLSLFIPNEGDDNTKMTVKTRVLPSLLEEKLKSLGLYMGPIGQKVVGSKGEEYTSPFKYMVGKEDRVVRIIYI